MSKALEQMKALRADLKSKNLCESLDLRASST